MALIETSAPDMVVVRGNITLFRVTEQWPAAGTRQLPTHRPAPMPQAVAVPRRSYLRAEVGFWLADDEIKSEAGVPLEETYIECQVINVGFWSFADARKHRGVQCCVTYEESLAVEALAHAMVG